MNAATVREVEERSGGRCEAGLPGCRGAATQLHHKKYKSRGGSDAAINLAHLCDACHEAVHRHRPNTEKFRTHSWQNEGEHEEPALSEEEIDRIVEQKDAELRWLVDNDQ